MQPIKKRGLAVTTVIPDQKATIIYNIGPIQDLGDQAIEKYRDATKCFHDIILEINVDWEKRDIDMKVTCLICNAAKLTKEVETK